MEQQKRARRRLCAVARHVAHDVAAAAAEQPYVPPLQLTHGQPPPVAAHGGLSYMSFSEGGGNGRRSPAGRALTDNDLGGRGPTRDYLGGRGTREPYKEGLGRSVLYFVGFVRSC